MPGVKSTTISVHGGKASLLSILLLYIEIHPHSQICFAHLTEGKWLVIHLLSASLVPTSRYQVVILKRHNSVLFFIL